MHDDRRLSRFPVCRSGVIGLSLVLTVLGGCGRGGPAYGPPPADAVVVDMSNTFSFVPETVRVPVGGTVEWRNTSIAKHTVTNDPRFAGDPAMVSHPAGTAPFNSGDIRPGEIYRVTFTAPGLYRYICGPHLDIFDMKGTVEVTP